MLTFTPVVNAFRFYSDGPENSSSPLAAQNTNLTPTVSADQDLQLRLRIDETGGADGATTDDYQLQCRINGGSWFFVPKPGSFGIECFDSTHFTNDSTTTNRATNGITDPGSGSFVTGRAKHAATILDHQLTTSNFTEHVWALKIVHAEITDGDVVEFRVTLNGSTMTNNVTPTITVTKSAAVSGSGSLVAQPSVVEGSGVSGSTGTGAPAASAVQVDGADAVVGSGSLVASAAVVVGAGASASVGDGELAAALTAVAGAGASSSAGAGGLAASPAQIAGAGAAGSSGAGSLAAALAALVGAGASGSVGAGGPGGWPSGGGRRGRRRHRGAAHHRGPRCVVRHEPSAARLVRAVVARRVSSIR